METVKCRTCGRVVGRAGIGSHYKAKHPNLYGKSKSALARQAAINKIMDDCRGDREPFPGIAYRCKSCNEQVLTDEAAEDGLCPKCRRDGSALNDE